MMNAEAAGHKFEGGRCRCGIFWCNIRNVTTDDIGRLGIAHVGSATPSEIGQIIKLATEEDRAIANAFGWTAPSAAEVSAVSASGSTGMW